MELKFKNSSIEKYKSDPKDFIGKNGRSKPVFTSFKMGAKYRGLCLREYPNREKHFVVRFRLRGERKKERIFPIGRFDPTLNVKTGDVLPGDTRYHKCNGGSGEKFKLLNQMRQKPA